MNTLLNIVLTFILGAVLGSVLTAINSPVPVKLITTECYKQTTDSKTMLHRIKCEVE